MMNDDVLSKGFQFRSIHMYSKEYTENRVPDWFWEWGGAKNLAESQKFFAESHYFCTNLKRTKNQ